MTSNVASSHVDTWGQIIITFVEEHKQLVLDSVCNLDNAVSGKEESHDFIYFILFIYLFIFEN